VRPSTKIVRRISKGEVAEFSIMFLLAGNYSACADSATQLEIIPEVVLRGRPKTRSSLATLPQMDGVIESRRRENPSVG
jgi:hypothetical protein